MWTGFRLKLSRVLAGAGAVALLALPAVASSGAGAATASPRAGTLRTYAFLAISCPTTTWCMAVGDSPGAPTLPLAESWNATSWTTLATPDPSGAKLAELTGVSCSSPTSCVAVGYEKTSGTGVRPPQNLSEIWNGTAWAIVPVPGAAGETNNQLNGVSCASADYCVAVGLADSGPGPGTSPAEPVAELWNGSAWSLMVAPDPTGTLESHFDAVSCPSASFCEAVGVDDMSGGQDILSETWDGSAWTIDAATGTNGVAQLEGVSCLSSSSCYAAGSQGNEVLIEHWNGSSLGGEAASGVNFAAVSCATTRACMATGLETATEWWNGVKWGNRGAIDPPGEIVTYLRGISCPSATVCVAVGQTSTRTVAEIWNGAKWVLLNPKF